MLQHHNLSFEGLTYLNIAARPDQAPSAVKLAAGCCFTCSPYQRTGAEAHWVWKVRQGTKQLHERCQIAS